MNFQGVPHLAFHKTIDQLNYVYKWSLREIGVEP